MKLDKQAMLLYVVTDRTWIHRAYLPDQVEEAIRAGATFVQLREKNTPYDEFVAEGRKLKEVTDRYQIPFVINDNIDVALAVDADGVHVGQSDMDVSKVRALIGDKKILGVSAQTVEQALAAEKNGADYIGVGAVFTTATKQDAEAVSWDMLRQICSSVSIPVVAIGGINEHNLLQLRGSGVDGAAVISAIFAQPNIYEATKKLVELSKEMTGGNQ